MKTLFITNECFAKSGGGTYTRGLIEVFRKIAGDDSFTVYFPYQFEEETIYKIEGISFSKRQKPKEYSVDFSKLLSSNFNGINVKEINEIIIREKIELVVMWRSIFAGILNHLNLDGVKVITIFHDICGHVLQEKAKKLEDSDFANQLDSLLFSSLNEKMALGKSDACVVLNSRDEQLFTKFYNREAQGIVPIFCKDDFDKNKCVTNTDEKCKLLFVGGYYWPNLIGIRWFVKNVMPRLDERFELNVVGRGMLRLKEELEEGNTNVHVIGRVDDIGEWYYDADIVVGPIFDGTGMKTKTVEALMYGKVYLGAQEALCGFDNMDDFLCLDADDFVDKIYYYYNKENRSKFCEYSRRKYLDNYSLDKIFEKLLGIISYM